MKKNKIPVIVIFAPTATGKTALTEKLFGLSSHSFFKGKAEIISADSMSVYKFMNLGTAKPNKNLQNQIPHYMIDLVTPDIQFSVSEFVEKADELCSTIFSSKKIPVISGGTGFYIRNFLLGLPQTPKSSPEIRDNLKHELEQSGLEYMYEKLKILDSESASKININDEYRILRALEVFYLTGKPRSSFVLPIKLREQYDFFTIILEREREELYKRIDARVEKMFQDGLEEEVNSLIKKGYKKEDPGMQAIGYREFFMNLPSNNAVKEKIKIDSHKYAKKQYVFMKGIPKAKVYMLPKNLDYTQELIFDLKIFLSKYNFVL